MRYFLLSIISFLALHLSGQIEGIILDENRQSLPGASVVLMPDSIIVISDDEGLFFFNDLGPQRYEIYSSFIGYKTDTTAVYLESRSPANLEIWLKPNSEVIETVVISDEHAKQEETLQTEHIHSDFLQRNLEGTFAQTIEKIAGISAINVGVGIAKPVIRGLSSNRIIVNHQGVKQESQQWGSDHGLEIDQYDIERVEIIKGPGSLQYGSDGLGGVINIMPDRIIDKNTFSGSVLGVHKTNNAHWGFSGKLAMNVNDWFLSGRFSRQAFADYRVPADVFTYNGFDLPILNNRLKNTAGIEENVNLTAGVKRDWGITRVLYSHYSLDAGLFSGAVGIPRSYALTDDGNSRDIDVPQQKVDHYRFSLNQTLFFGENHLAVAMGFQRNLRQELSQPEFHSIPLSQLGDLNDKLAIELELETFSIDAHYEHVFSQDVKNIFGFNTQWQKNERNGFEYLLPDFNTFRGGIYSISEWIYSDQLLLNGGVRLDLGNNNTDYYRQYIWDSNENIIDSLISPSTDDQFFNWSASIGANLSLYEGKWTLKGNLGKSFRVPYPAETVSNGIHHGTFRHEVGTPDLDSEHGYQLDLGAYWSYEKIDGSLSFYFNYFDNYIYLGPTFPARFSRLPEAGQIFQYRQDDAIYTGFELQWDWDVQEWLSLNQAIDFVQSYNPKTRLALPFTPQPSMKTDVTFSLLRNMDYLDNAFLEIGHQYHFAAEGSLRVDRSERPTPGYQLWDIGIGADIHIGNQEIELRAKVQNAFNTAYLSHLSRYRVINIPEQGRNVVISLKVPFKGSL